MTGWYDYYKPGGYKISGLYHHTMGIPLNANTQLGEIMLNYSEHALNAAKNDEYSNIINLPKSLDTSKSQVIEVEMIGNKTIKVLYKVHYDEQFDLFIAVLPDRKYVKTVWLSKKDDLHETLNKTKYDIPRGFAPVQEPLLNQVDI